MTSKIKIDIAKIKEEREQHAKNLELYKSIQAKPKNVSSLIKFDELKKFQELGKVVDEPSIPVDEYTDPSDYCVLCSEEYLSVFNAGSAYKRAVYRKGQANIKINNILKYNDYSKEEQREIGLNILNLMSVHPENTDECFNILDKWLFEWQPLFLDLCVLLENFGCNVRSYLKSHHCPSDYEVTLLKAKVDYEEFNTKSNSKYLRLNEKCLKNTLTYLKCIIGYFNADEVQSLLVVLSALSLDSNCIQLKDLFNDLVNRCFVCLENTNMENILNTLYLLFEKSIHQCYFVNSVLSPCNSVCKPFTIQLAYLFMCNLLFNHNLATLDTSVGIQDNASSDSSLTLNESQKYTRSKRKLHGPLKNQSSPKKQTIEKLLFEKENSRSSSVKSNGVKKIGELELKEANRNIKAVKGKEKRKKRSPELEKSILDFCDLQEKSSDLANPSKHSSLKEEVDKLKACINTLDKVLPSTSNGVSSLKKEELETQVSTTCIDLTEDSLESEEFLTDTPCNELRILVFFKFKADTVTLPKLYKLIRHHLQHFLDCPVRIYRIVNLLNLLVNLIDINENNIDICKLLMQELSGIQFKYYGLHDMHRHLVCVYLQQYTTVWGTFVNKIQYQMQCKNEEDEISDED